MTHKEDSIRLLHMLDSAKEAVSFVEKRKRSDLDTDRMLLLALIRSIEIIGEAASQVTKETQLQYPDIPWAAIIGMRNRLIHAYFNIDIDRVWDTVFDDLPVLIRSLENIVKPEV